MNVLFNLPVFVNLTLAQGSVILSGMKQSLQLGL